MRFFLVISCLCVTIARAALAQSPPKPPWGLGMENTIPVSVPTRIRSRVGADLEYDDSEPMKGVVFDLDGDGVKDYLLQSAPSLCGNGGCIYVLCDGATGRKLGQFFGSPLYIRAERD